jgi:carotenoid 1,2-hydratase
MPNWMRAPLADGSTVVAYDVQQRGGRADRLLATRFWPDGRHAAVELPPAQPLQPTGWRIQRSVRHDATSGGLPQVLRTLEDTPFYARSVVRTQLCGQTVDAMHETLSATRFASPVVQALLPFRMPRRGGGAS